MKGAQKMKKFETPVIEVEKLNIVDVITTSCTEDVINCDNDLGL